MPMSLSLTLAPEDLALVGLLAVPAAGVAFVMVRRGDVSRAGAIISRCRAGPGGTASAAGSAAGLYQHLLHPVLVWSDHRVPGEMSGRAIAGRAQCPATLLA